MTAFHLISDVHLNFADLTLPGGDILVMAGDILEVGHLRIADNAKKDVFLADRYRRFIREELAKYEHVIYVAGNHESYANSFEDTHPRLRKELPDNVYLLENDSVEIDGVLFYGCTFWTDCNRGDPITMHTLREHMYDYRGIHHSTGIKVHKPNGHTYYTHKFTPEYTAGIHRHSKYLMGEFLKNNRDKPVVVVTHHAPTELSLDPMYINQYHMNGGYHSRCGEFILDHPNIRCWVAGHTHHTYRYYVGDTLVAANPRGYKGFEQLANNFIVRTIDLNRLPDKQLVFDDYSWTNLS